jgi:hypothetical protein
MTGRSIDHSADVSGPMDHAVAEYPVMQGSWPSAGWQRLGRAFAASIIDVHSHPILPA